MLVLVVRPTHGMATKNEEAAEPLAEWERELLEQSTAAAETVEAPAAEEAAPPAEAEKEAE